MKKSGFSITFLFFIALIILVIIFISSRINTLGENSLEGLTTNPASTNPASANPATTQPPVQTTKPFTTQPPVQTTKPFTTQPATTDSSTPSVTTSGVVYTTFTPSANVVTTTSTGNKIYEPVNLESAIKSLQKAVIVREQSIKTGNNKKTVETLKNIISQIKTIIDNKE